MRLLNWQIAIILCLLSFVIGCFFTYLLFINNTSELSDISIVSAIISSVGSIFGGLIGGVIAFAIARSQFSADKDREISNKIQIYLNLIKSLKIEMMHNQKILKYLTSFKTREDRSPYTSYLKFEVWDKVKYNVNNFLPVVIFTMIEEQNQEFKEIQEEVLPDYKNGEVDFQLRLDVTTKIIQKLESEEEIYIKQVDNFK